MTISTKVGNLISSFKERVGRLRSKSSISKRVRSPEESSLEINNFLEEEKKKEAVFAAFDKEKIFIAKQYENKHIPEKALTILGDEFLDWKDRNVVTAEIRQNVSPKTLHLMGDYKLLTKKSQKILGDPFTIHENKRQKRLSLDFLQKKL
eukprot:snap_masked-scaffold_5-processed-gene-16.58-mRNA-1 protein AED:1.00 eAED:1.00 QI:0/-1/0/0/-1/1/1/0/149